MRHDPANEDISLQVCLAYLYLGQCARAIAVGEKLRAGDPDDQYVYAVLTAAYAQLGAKAKAAAARDELRGLAPDSTIAGIKNRVSKTPEFLRLSEEHYSSGLRKAGTPEQ